MRTQTSKLFVFEGANEVGKSTLAAMLTRKLRHENGACDLFAFPGNETGTLGRHIYNFHHSAKKFGVKRIEATSLQLLHIAAHVDSITSKILPALQRGRIVVLDRFWWSTWVYGLAAGAEREILRAALDVEHLAWKQVRPTRIFLVTRSTPLVRPKDMRHWKDISARYKSFVAQEGRCVPVTIVANDSNVEEAFQEVTKALL